MRQRSNAGFTLLEVTISGTILALVMLNISMVTKTGSAAYQAGIFESALEDEASQTMDRITLAVMSSSEDAIDPVPIAPANAWNIDYEVSLGIQAGELVLDDPERIELVTGTGQVLWKKNPDLPEQRSLVWSKSVPDNFGDELPNGIDDNGNGLIDERGLSFDMIGSKIIVRLQLMRADPDGVTRQTAKVANVTCRN
ncbi:MAG: hypothetical protein ACI8QZ_001075 [Chlamydiales bacterium]|jgi:hypothetical protein